MRFPFTLWRLLMDIAPAHVCPDEMKLAAYADGKMLGKQKQQFQRHLAGCERCRDTLGLLLRAQRTAPPPVPGDMIAAALQTGQIAGRRPWMLALGGAGTIAILALIVSRLIEPAQVRPPEMTRRVTTPTIVAKTSEPILSLGRPPASALRGSGAQRTIVMISPAEGAHVSGRLRLRWHAANGADGYEIRVMTEEGDVRWETRTTEAEVTVPADIALRAGTKYFVDVLAHLNDGSTVRSAARSFYVKEAR
jgi:hypothetical protein